MNKGPRETPTEGLVLRSRPLKGCSQKAEARKGPSPGRLSLGYLALAATPAAADGLDNLFAVIA